MDENKQSEDAFDLQDPPSCSKTVEMAEVCDWCDGEGCDTCQAEEQDGDSMNTMDDSADMMTGLTPLEEDRIRELQGRTVFDAVDVALWQRNMVLSFADLACIPLDLAEALLRAHRWDEAKLRARLASEDGITSICESEGLPYTSSTEAFDQDCIPGTCQADVFCDEAVDAPLYCGHRVCKDCLSGAVAAALGEEGRDYLGVLALTCPASVKKDGQEIRCPAPLPVAMVIEAAPKDMQDIIKRGYIDDFAEQAPSMHACPAPGCKHIIHAVTGIKDKDVQCPCGALVCSACGFLHGHAPASCDFVTIYEDVMDPERRTKEFLAVAVKDCPKCKVPVEKNKHCNHMTCSRCRYQWCWLCNTRWQDHKGDFYNCRQVDDNDEKIRQRALFNQRQQLFVVHQKSCEDAQKISEWSAGQLSTLPEELDVLLPLLREALMTLCRGAVNLKWAFAMAPFVKADSRGILAATQRGHLRQLVYRVHDLLSAGPLERFKVSQTWQMLHTEVEKLAKFRVAVTMAYKEMDIDSIVRSTITVDSAKDMPWGCIRCFTVHKGRNQVAMKLTESDTVDVGVQAKFARGSNMEICAKCLACRQHSEEDCRQCFSHV